MHSALQRGRYNGVRGAGSQRHELDSLGRRSGHLSANPATSSRGIITSRSANHAKTSAFATPVVTIARMLAATGSSSVSGSSRFQRRSISKIGSRACQRFGSCADLSMIVTVLRNHVPPREALPAGRAGREFRRTTSQRVQPWACGIRRRIRPLRIGESMFITVATTSKRRHGRESNGGKRSSLGGS